jgi:hypothetical protein
MLPNVAPDEVLANYALVCPACKGVVISDESELSCMRCSHRFKLGDARSLIEVCRR